MGAQALACSCYEECRLKPAPQKTVTNEGIFSKTTTLTHHQEMIQNYLEHHFEPKGDDNFKT